MKITYIEHEGGIPDVPRTIDVPAAVLDAFEAAMLERCDAESGHVAGCDCEQP